MIGHQITSLWDLVWLTRYFAETSSDWHVTLLRPCLIDTSLYWDLVWLTRHFTETLSDWYVTLLRPRLTDTSLYWDLVWLTRHFTEKPSDWYIDWLRLLLTETGSRLLYSLKTVVISSKWMASLTSCLHLHYEMLANILSTGHLLLYYLYIVLIITVSVESLVMFVGALK